MNRRTRLALVAALLVAGPAAAQNRGADTGQSAVPEEVRAWLSANAIPLDTTEPEKGLADLEPLKAMIGGARLVVMGEATHGTREFFQLKHRVFEYLVTQMEFTVFGIEASMPETRDINEYVLHGTGDPRMALGGLYFWTWDTEEVLEMIEWMRRYNADPAHDRKLKFYGFDMQHPTRAAKVVLDYLRRVDPHSAAMADSAFAFLTDPFTQLDFDVLPSSRRTSIAASAAELVRSFDANGPAWSDATSADEWADARQHATILAQNLEMRSGENMGARDRSMADNIAWILEQEGPESKMLAWAHNAHAANVTWLAPMMGANLHERFGADFITFGFAFNQGSFVAFDNTSGLRQFTVGPAPDGSLDAALAGTGLPLAAVDLRALPDSGPVADWFGTPRGTRWVLSAFSESAVARELFPIEAAKYFDGLLFVETTTAARSNPWLRVQPLVTLPEPANLDFEGGPAGEFPAGWRSSSRRTGFDYRVVTVDGGRNGVGRAVHVSRLAGRPYGETYGGLEQAIDAEPYRGRTLTLNAATRRQGESGTVLYVWVRVTTADGEIAVYEKEADRSSVGEWRDHRITFEVPDDATGIEYGLALVGGGQAWLDAVSLEVHPEVEAGTSATLSHLSQPVSTPRSQRNTKAP